MSSDLFIIAAIVIGPILAVQAQKAIESIRERKHNKLNIFKTLMATRGTLLSPAHVEALNMIDLEFTEKKPKEKKVIEAWKIYRDHLHSLKTEHNDPNYSVKLDSWTKKREELLADLLYEMASSVGYDFDKVHLKKGSYTPRGHTDIESEQGFIRRSIVDLFLGSKSFPVHIIEHPTQEKKRSEKET